VKWEHGNNPQAAVPGEKAAERAKERAEREEARRAAAEEAKNAPAEEAAAE
jgi:small subunit ribosomal protein S16